MKHAVAIIGAGAAGLMCALTAARRGRDVVVLEHNSIAGKKILASGGGRCNFSNRSISAANYLSANKHFAKSALARFSTDDFISLLDKHDIPWTEEEDGKLFCSRSSRDIAAMLLEECRDAGVTIITGCKVNSVVENKIKNGASPVRPELVEGRTACASTGSARTGSSFSFPSISNRESHFTIRTNKGIFEVDKIVIATGGLSCADLGASDFGYRIAEQFNISVTKLKPGLTPLKFNSADLRHFGNLAGVSLNAKVSCAMRSFSGGILFTHKGLSGPAILNISSVWEKGEKLSIDLFPSADILRVLSDKHELQSREELKNVLAKRMPRRLALALCDTKFGSRPIASYGLAELKSIAATLHSWETVPASAEGYSKAEVTVGGIDTAEISSKTMEAKSVPGLYFIGEVLDVTGELGGFNLHWAWASGFAAGEAV